MAYISLVKLQISKYKKWCYLDRAIKRFGQFSGLNALVEMEYGDSDRVF